MKGYLSFFACLVIVTIFLIAPACLKSDEEEDPRGTDLMENDELGGGGGGSGDDDCGGCDNSITTEECNSAVEFLYSCGGFFAGPDGVGFTEDQAYDLCEMAGNFLICAFLCIEENGDDCDNYLDCVAASCPS